MRRPLSALALLVTIPLLGVIPTATADAAPAAKRTVAKAGSYVGNFYTSKGKRLEQFTFKVNKKGTKLNKFRALVNVTCGSYPVSVATHPLSFSGVKIKQNGSFKRTWNPAGADGKVTIKGSFKGKKLRTGTLDYRAGVCVRTAQLKATRR